jgi:hypothetical protein
VKKECHDLKEETLPNATCDRLFKCPEYAYSMPKSKEANPHDS